MTIDNILINVVFLLDVSTIIDNRSVKYSYTNSNYGS